MLKTEGEAGGAPSDWSLLERVVRRDEAALSELYDRYSGLVYSEAKRILRDAGAAEEILQDLFYQVWRTAGRIRTGTRIAGGVAGGGGAEPGNLQVAPENREKRRTARKRSGFARERGKQRGANTTVR